MPLRPDTTPIFVSYSTKDFEFVETVVGHLGRVFKNLTFLAMDQRDHPDHQTKINGELKSADICIVFLGDQIGRWQKDEIQAFQNIRMDDRAHPRMFVVVDLRKPGASSHDFQLQFAASTTIHVGGNRTRDDAFLCAKEIARTLGLRLPSLDGLPHDPRLFEYEKDIVEYFATRSTSPNAVNDKRQFDGCPSVWPSVRRCLWPKIEMSDDVESDCRRPKQSVNVAAYKDGMDARQSMILLEAGPREPFVFPRPGKANFRVAILVSGGIAPGINAVIHGIVERHWSYRTGKANNVEIFGFRNGWLAFDDLQSSSVLLHPDKRRCYQQPTCPTLETAAEANRGGSMIGTSRYSELLDRGNRRDVLEGMANQIFDRQIDILYVIGGDGSLKAAHALWTVAEEIGSRSNRHFSVIGIPKTTDNDILWVWQSFGFLSAVERAREFVDQLHAEVSSNPRICVQQLFGSESGFVVSHSVLAAGAGACDLALIPEVPFSMVKVAEYLRHRILEEKRTVPSALVVLAETAIPSDAPECLGAVDLQTVSPKYRPFYECLRERLRVSDEERNAVLRSFDFDSTKPKKRQIRPIVGETDDTIRRAGLKIVSESLRILLTRSALWRQNQQSTGIQWARMRVFANEPRHLLRTVPPSTADMIMGHRLGVLAVDNALAGYTDFMISQWLTEYVLVPLDLVVLGRKRIPKSGMFWRGVVSKTGQWNDEDLNLDDNDFGDFMGTQAPDPGPDDGGNATNEAAV